LNPSDLVTNLSNTLNTINTTQITALYTLQTKLASGDSLAISTLNDFVIGNTIDVTDTGMLLDFTAVSSHTYPPTCTTDSTFLTDLLVLSDSQCSPAPLATGCTTINTCSPGCINLNTVMAA
jgi:hypothetical protein